MEQDHSRIGERDLSAMPQEELNELRALLVTRHHDATEMGEDPSSLDAQISAVDEVMAKRGVSFPATEDRAA